MKIGWIRQTSDTNKFVMSTGCESKDIRKALVFRTRNEARTSSMPGKLTIDTVRKVELSKNGKAKRIIKRR